MVESALVHLMQRLQHTLLLLWGQNRIGVVKESTVRRYVVLSWSQIK